MKTTLRLVHLATVASGCASYAGNTGGWSGSILTTETGMALYTFDKDADAQSNCYDTCAAKWHPYLTTDGDAPSVSASNSTRKDGSLQWMIDNKPLYEWVGDEKPGDTTGNGVGGV